MGQRINETKFNELYAEWKASGLSVRDYCFNASISERVFHYWNLKRKNKEMREQGSFMPVNITRTVKGGVVISSHQLTPVQGMGAKVHPTLVKSFIPTV